MTPNETPNETPQDGRQHDVGHQIETQNGTFEVTAVSYQEDQDGNKVNFSYTIRSKEDLNREWQAEQDRLAKVARQEEEAKAQAEKDATEEAAHHNPIGGEN